MTQWTRYDNSCAALATRDLWMGCQPIAEARFVIFHSYDGYTTNVTLDDFAAEDALLANSWSGKPITGEHGGPVRLVCRIGILEERKMDSGDRILPKTSPATGKSAAITTEVIHGLNNGIRGDRSISSP